MKRIFITIAGALAMLMGFYIIITLLQITFGNTTTKFKDIAVPTILVLAFFFYIVSRKYKEETKTEEQDIQVKEKKDVDFVKEKSNYIITASSNVCSALASRLEKHPLVLRVYEDSGFWYSNGETGPEWFTVTIQTHWKNKKEIEDLVKEELKKLNKSANNFYWG